MLEAILVGLKSSQNMKDWGIYSPSGTSASKLAESIGAQWVQNLDEVNPNIVFVGCKPQQLKDLKVTIQDRFSKALFVSVLAAISEEDQRKILGVTKLVRVMPNLPVKYNQGVSLVSSSSAPESLAFVDSLFSHLGTSLVLTEAELEELTLLTGSGPAFFYEFSKNLADSFTSLDESKREKLARSVLLGAAYSTQKSKESLAQMTHAVTSKGGVTVAVLENWREAKLFSLMKAGIEAGKKRSQELKKLIHQS